MRSILFVVLLFVFAQGSSQQVLKVDFTQMSADLSINAVEREVTGSVEYDFEVKKTADTISIDAVDMQFQKVVLNNKAANFLVSKKAIKLLGGFKKGKYKLSFTYKAKPKQALYFTGTGSHQQIWTQGQGKYTSNWLPSFDDVNEKLVFSLNIKYANEFTVLSNGILKEKTRVGEELVWHYQMKKPMSSYLVMLTIGKFSCKKGFSKSGVPLEWYFEPSDSNKVATTYNYSKELFDYLERETGMAYPWQIYRQVPVRDFLYAGMENTTATVFSRDYVVDATGYNDRQYTNVNAHELAHQWFGNVITAKSGKHHWLQEGFATYYALLAEKEVYGDHYFYWQLYEMATNLEQAAKKDTIPVLNERASSLSFYQKGAWALHALREEIGVQAFRKAVSRYLKKHAFLNVTTEDFLTEVSKVSTYNVQDWKIKWLESGAFPVDIARKYLERNNMMKQLYALNSLQELPRAHRRDNYKKLLTSSVYFPLKEEVVFRIADWPFSEKADLLDLALETGNLRVRRAVAQTMQDLPKDKYRQYEALLQDRSYITNEIALNMLYGQFPEHRFHLLDQTKHYEGFNDKNLRMLWLTLALSTDGYQTAEKLSYYDELVAYADASQEGKMRRNAIEKLLYLNENDTRALRLIVGLLLHHDWQISKYARDTIRFYLKRESHLKYYRELLSSLPYKEHEQLSRLLSAETSLK